jgi:hypothetical protein
MLVAALGVVLQTQATEQLRLERQELAVVVKVI